MRLSILIAFAAFTALFVTSPVAPIVAGRAGSPRDAGIITFLFSATTVITQIFVPRLLALGLKTRFLAVALVALGVPNLVFILTPDVLSSLLVATAIRGVGFGVVSVMTSLIITRMAPDGQLGRALGLYGAAVAISAMIFPPVGLFLASTVGFEWAFVVSLGSALVAAFAAMFLRTPPLDSPRNFSVISILRRHDTSLPAAISWINAFTYGGIISFVPLILLGRGTASAAAYFLVFGVAQTVGRLLSGPYAEKTGARRSLLIGVIVTLFGTGGLAADLGTAALLASGACFGIGSAMIRNASYIAMLKSVTTSEYGAVSTLWNLSIDFGIGFGSLVLGVVVGNTGIPFMFWLLPIVTAFAIPLAFSVKKIY